MPLQWATTQFLLGSALTIQGERMGNDKAAALFDQAVQDFQAVLQVFTQTDQPQQWAATQLGIGLALMLEGDFVASDKSRPLYDQSAQAIQSALQIYTKSGLPQFWAPAQLAIVMQNLASGNFTQCLQQDALLTDDAITPYQALARDTLKLACAWGAQDKPSALATAKMLLARPFPSPFTQMDLASAYYSIAQSSAFQSGRASWLALFTAVQKDSSSGVAGALQQLEPIFR